MDDLQNLTDEDVKAVEFKPTPEEKRLKAQQDQWITYCALGGVITEAGFEYKYNQKLGQTVAENIRRVSVTEFAQQLQVSRWTLYNWSKTIPNFADKVRERRTEIIPVARETAAFNQLYMLGMQTQDKRAAVDALKAYLGHFSKLKLATQPTEIDASQNLIDLVNVARKRKVIEGEVVEPVSDTGTST